MLETAPGNFVHLRVHSEFSLVDGLIKPKKLAARVAELQMPAVALTDNGNFFGLIKFYSAARAQGVKPIVGVDLRYRNAAGLFWATLFATNNCGYRRLKRLTTELYTTSSERGVLDRQQLLVETDGLICLSGGQAGEIGCALSMGEPEVAERLANVWHDAWGDRFYLEVQRLGNPLEEDYIDAIVALAAEQGLPIVATNPVCFGSADDFEAHETRVCIQQGRTLNDPRRERAYRLTQYLKSPAEMAELFSDLPSALENTVEIARRCNLEIELGNYQLPQYPVPAGVSLEDFLVSCVTKGLQDRLYGDRGVVARTPDWTDEREEAYRARMRFELDVIMQMGFPGYFLIVMEFIAWAKDNKIPVGPGRGSGAGSLVAWSLGITDLDPIAGKLLFERFLNPERVSMPDFDIDFCMEGRDKVIAHVSETYGKDSVSQIATFGTMAAKAVVRDVARVQGKPYGLADKLSKMIPFEVGMTLAKAHAQSDELRNFIKGNDEVGEIMEMAYKLEGIVRNVGKHAGGVVIAPTELTEFTPLYADEGSTGLISQFDKDDVESAGLVKFDFLGLKTLTIIDWAVAAINERSQRQTTSAELRIEDIDLADARTFELLRHARTTAVFQLESRGMKDLIRKLLPDSMNDIIALVAIYRPGPMQTGADLDYINRKHGRAAIEYPHPSLSEVLNETYGVVLYQEQVMQIAQVLAGFSLGQADLLRRAMGKKKPLEMARVRAQFLEGTTKAGVDTQLSNEIFDLMEKFAGYAFNKSHSATYALVSYQTAWLKANHPSEFMAATLSVDMQNTDKVVTLIDEVRRMDLRFQPPSVNCGSYRFSVVEDNIVYGLGAIKGVGRAPVEAIVEARTSGGDFVDLNDFCRRVDARRVNKRVLEVLVKSGAMDCFALDDADAGDSAERTETLDVVRARLLGELADAVAGAEQVSRDVEIGMQDMFGELAAAPPRIRVQPLEKRDRLEGEKDTLGLYLSGHPIDDYLAELRHFCPARIANLTVARPHQLLAGWVVNLRITRSKRGDNMAFALLDDRSGRVEISLFADVYEKHREKLSKDLMIVVQGEVQGDEYTQELRVRVSEVFTIEEARARFAHHLEVQLCAERRNTDIVQRLRDLLEPHRRSDADSCRLRVRLNYATASARGQLELPATWSMQPSDELLRSLQNEFGSERVSYAYET